MTFNSIGDLASSIMLNQANVQAKRNMTRLSQELTTGLTSDVGGALRNDFSRQLSWERGITTAQIREKTLTEALTRVQTKQTVLAGIAEATSSLANDATLALTVGTEASLDAVSNNAIEVLSQTLARLNTQTAGHSLFSGSQSDGPATASVEAVMTSVKSVVTGATSTTDILARVETWMNDGLSGFPVVGYLGSSEDAGTIRLGQGRVIQEGSRADDPALKEAIQKLVVASLAGDDDLTLTRESKMTLIRDTADGLRSAEGRITQLQANIGYVEAEVTKSKVQAGTEISTAEQLRTSTMGVDQFETASRLQQTELQLEKIYMLTARSARMSLLEYLR